MGQSVAEVLMDAAVSGASLHVRVGSGESSVEFWVADKALCGYSVSDRKSRLASKLVASGLIGRAELDAVRRAAGRDASVEHAVAGRISRDALNRIALEEVQVALSEVLECSGEDVVVDSDDPPPDAGEVAADLEYLLTKISVEEEQALADQSRLAIPLHGLVDVASLMQELTSIARGKKS